MTDVEKLFEAGSQELDLDDLGEVSGGKVRIEGYGILMELIAKYKKQGKSKEDCIASVVCCKMQNTLFTYSLRRHVSRGEI